MKAIVILILLLFSACQASNAADTNSLFVTDEGFLSLNYSSKLAEAKTNRECLPASEFTEGNWGAETNGFQLSMRLAKRSFAKGEPIEAVILLRNVTNKVVTYTVSAFLGEGQVGPIGLRVFAEHGEALSPRPPGITVGSAKGADLQPKTQRKYIERVDKTYDLGTAGTYFAQAWLTVSCPKCMVIDSAKVPIQIVNSTASPDTPPNSPLKKGDFSEH